MHVVYVVPSSFAHVAAGALRNVSLAAALTGAGHRVTILSTDPEDLAVDDELSRLLKENHVTLFPAGLPGNRHAARSRVFRNLLGGIAGLSARLDSLSPDVLIQYNSDPACFARLRAYARGRGIPIVVDLTEWLNPDSLPGGRLGPLGLTHDLSMRRFMPRADAGIAISTAMAALAGSSGRPVLVVPPLSLVSPQRTDGGGTADGRLRIVSVGIQIGSGGKDAFGLVHVGRALKAVDPSAERFAVDVVGPTAEQLNDLQRHAGEAFPHMQPRGRRTWHDTLDLVEQADLSLVLRDPVDRRCNYGFPSKLPESLMLGTPVLTNAYSDITSHITDGSNGLIASTVSTACMGRLLQRADQLWAPERIAAEAREKYHPSSWARRLSDFLQGAREAAIHSIGTQSRK